MLLCSERPQLPPRICLVSADSTRTFAANANRCHQLDSPRFPAVALESAFLSKSDTDRFLDADLPAGLWCCGQAPRPKDHQGQTRSVRLACPQLISTYDMAKPLLGVARAKSRTVGHSTGRRGDAGGHGICRVSSRRRGRGPACQVTGRITPSLLDPGRTLLTVLVTDSMSTVAAKIGTPAPASTQGRNAGLNSLGLPFLRMPARPRSGARRPRKCGPGH